MEYKELTIDDLLKSLQNPNEAVKDLPNTSKTWSRIASKDAFEELELEGSELDTFLAEWTKDNPYSNI